MGNGELIDAMIHDGLWDPYDHLHMGNCGELCAKEYGFSREAQDEFARRELPPRPGRAEGGPVQGGDRAGRGAAEEGRAVGRRRRGAGARSSSRSVALKPAFQKDGTITAANASSINDGAAALRPRARSAREAAQPEPLARIVGRRRGPGAGVVHDRAGRGDGTLVREDRPRAGDCDLYEINEAFAGGHDGGDQLCELDPRARQRPRRRGRARSPHRRQGARILRRCSTR